MKGRLYFPAKWFTLFRPLNIIGGPFDKAPDQLFTVSLRGEAPPRSADLYFPIDDFSIPKNDARLEQALKIILGAMLSGKIVYVGCMAGQGRTGLMFSLLSKILDAHADPVSWVRANYFAHAVETEEQKAFVGTFDPAPYRTWIFWAALRVARGKLVFDEPQPSHIAQVA